MILTHNQGLKNANENFNKKTKLQNIYKLTSILAAI